MRNIFEQELHTRPLDGHFVHATIVPIGRRFYSCIEVGTENAVLYSRELPFDTQREAESDLRTQLRFLYETPLDELRQAALMPEDYDREPFSIRDHRRMSIEAAEDQSGEFDTHVPGSIDDPHPKLHYLSSRLEHYSPRPNLRTIDPSYYGTGVSGLERRRKKNDPQNWVDRSYYYDVGTDPEEMMQGMYRYEGDLPEDARIYDIGEDPEHLVELAKNPGGFGVDLTLLERKIMEAGYFGFRNTRSALPNAVGLFYPLDVRPPDDSGVRAVREAFVTSYFVKRAGSTENYLQSLGAQPEVIQYVVSQPTDIAKKLVNEVRKNHALTLDQLQQMSEQMAGKQTYKPTPREMVLANRYVSVASGMADWVFLQCKKYRKKKVGGEFEYHWPEGTLPQQGILNRAPGWSLSYIQPIFDQIGDWARAMNIQLASYDLPRAMNESNKWHEEEAAKGGGNGYEEKNIVHSFSNGWTIREVRTERDLQVEGNLMGHCVGSYCGPVQRGDSTIFSLRDPQNAPHVTIEMEGRAQMNNGVPITYFNSDPEEKRNWRDAWEVVQIQGKGNAEPIPEYKAMIKEWFTAMGGGKNILMQTTDEPIEDTIYGADPEDYEAILRGERQAGDEYGLNTDVPIERKVLQEWNNNGAAALESLYHRVLDGFRKYLGTREEVYLSRRMDPAAEALADLAWDIDTAIIKRMIEGTLPPNYDFAQKGPGTSAMGGINLVQDEHMQEFDKWTGDFSAGPYPDEDDYETPEEFEKAVEQFQELEQEARDDAYRNWMPGGMDLAINDRWHQRVKAEFHGLWPWEVMANLKSGKPPFEPTERVLREQRVEQLKKRPYAK